jgi:cytochrome c
MHWCLVLFVCGAAFAKDTPEQFFNKRVAPVLTRRCLPCHNNELDNRGLSFQKPETVLAVLTPGDPDKSLLIQVLKHEGQLQMPPGPPLPKREIEILREWVRQGAVMGKLLK